jgi:tight adherence protein C
MTAAGALGALAAIAACASVAEVLRSKGSRVRVARVLSRLTVAVPPPPAALAGGRSWLRLKLACALALVPPAALLASTAPGRLAVVVCAGAAAAGFATPDLWLRHRLRLRLERALRELPAMLDLLRVSVEAGMPTARALGAVGAELDGPMAAEWRMVAGAVALGVPQDEAFGQLAERMPSEEITAFVQALLRSRRHGVPVARVLAAQAAAARHRRRRRIAERAAKAGPKIQLVVALVMVPAVLLMVVAGLLAQLEGAGFGYAAS